MDPISVSASILGLLGAAAKISEVLTHFVRGVKDAPKLALRTLTEVEDLKICFRQLQHFVNAEGGRRKSHDAMVTIDQFLVVITHAVMTFSELEAAVEGLRPRTASMINARLRWITKENTVSQLLQRLQASNTRIDEAREATESLTGVVNGVLDTTQSIRHRLEQSNLPVQVKHQSAPSALESTMDLIEDDASTVRRAPTAWASDALIALENTINPTDTPASTMPLGRSTWASDALTVVDSDPQFGFTFDPDLRASRVYSRSTRAFQRRSDPDQLSLPSSTGISMGSSFLSGISLAEVSNISLMSFPLPYEPTRKYAQARNPRTMWLPPSHYATTLPRLQKPRGKIAVLGVSNAGKSTIVKQLLSMQGTRSSDAEIEQARNMVCAKLFEVFQDTCYRDEDLQSHLLAQYCQFLSTASSDPEKSDAFFVLQQFWRSSELRHAVGSAKWPSVPNNISYIMDKIDKILWYEEANNFDPSLCVHIMTNGIYRSTIIGEPFEYEIVDVGGSRASRKKWIHTMDDLDSVIYVADLNAYCQNIEEDPDQNQFRESLSVFENLVNSPRFQNTSFLLLLNKADLFKKTILHHPISDYDPEYDGGVDYREACRYMADHYVRRDQRPPGKLHCFVVDSLDTTAFQKIWRQVQERIFRSINFGFGTQSNPVPATTITT
ncbi:MAG: hypothetical protein Q9169_005345 [Polycauliona sp. 2 TL-2023]